MWNVWIMIKAFKYCGKWLNILIPDIYGPLLYFVKFANSGWRLLLFLFLYLWISLLAVNKCFLSTVNYSNEYTGCPRRNVQDFGRVFLMLKYTDITQNTYIQSCTVTEIMAREIWNFDSCYTLIDYQIHIKTGRNMWFL